MHFRNDLLSHFFRNTSLCYTYKITFPTVCKENKINSACAKIIIKMFYFLKSQYLHYNCSKLTNIYFLFSRYIILMINKIQMIFNIFEHNVYLNRIDLSSNMITVLKKENFKYLKQLHYLNMSSNLIWKIEDSMFSKLKNVTYLNLSYNRIQSIGDHVFKGTYTRNGKKTADI